MMRSRNSAEEASSFKRVVVSSNLTGSTGGKDHEMLPGHGVPLPVELHMPVQ
jgi:hypothetical protein